LKSETFWFKDRDGVDIFVYKWLPHDKTRGVVQIAHGAVEHAARYRRVAEELTKNGYIVYANDHRGHGITGEKFGKMGYLGPGGWESTVYVLNELTEIIKKEWKEIPVFLLGHSWGSFLTQDYIHIWSDKLQGAIFSGTTGLPLPEVERDAEGMGLNFLIDKPKTPFDWLSRDEYEVQKYIDDPFCGFSTENTGFMEAMVDAWPRLLDPENDKKISKNLAVYIFAGSMDPVGGEKGVKKLFERYKTAGLNDVTYKIYQQGRHEMFNEINRDEVIKDLILWLDSHV
jgi:alpha-beta hydrolase superfamily lysophospholipase